MSCGLTDTRSQPDPERPAFAVRMSALRAAKGQSLQFVADRVGLSKTHVRQLENGDSDNPGLSALTAIARHYGVTVAYLIGESEMTAAHDKPVADFDLSENREAAERALKRLSPMFGNRPSPEDFAAMDAAAKTRPAGVPTAFLKAQALELAIKHHAQDNKATPQTVMQTAAAFLPFLRGDMTGMVQEAAERGCATPAETAKTIGELARRGDIVQIDDPSLGTCTGNVIMAAARMPNFTEPALLISRGVTHPYTWVPVSSVKAILRKASEAVR